MKTADVSQLQAWKQGEDAVQIVDVRSPGEYQAGHIPGAMNIPLECVLSRRADLNENVPIVLVCQSGKRAAMAYQCLEGAFGNLQVLEGGTMGWKEAGLPVVAEQRVAWSLERQVRFVAGLLVLTGTLGSLFWRPLLGIAAFIGGGLTFAALTDWCGMGLLLAKMPWNRPLPLIHRTNSCAAQKAQ